MTSEVFPCCCGPSVPCICAPRYTSILVKWTGSVTFKPLPCREYYRRYFNGDDGCGFPSRLVLPSQTTYTIPSIVVPGLNAFTCSSFACVQRQSQVNRYFASFIPPIGSSEFYDPVARCQYDQLDTIFGPYQLFYRHQVTVFGPNTAPQFGQPPIPQWRVRVQIGTIILNFISNGDQFSCLPTDFRLDPSQQIPDLTKCHGPCLTDGACFGQNLDDCTILNPPPPPSTWPGNGLPGVTTGHEVVDIDIGSIQLG